jgi:hypothetical protein
MRWLYTKLFNKRHEIYVTKTAISCQHAELVTRIRGYLIGQALC